jgi:integrase
MANRRERPVSRVNPSGERVWRARATDPAGRRRYLGAFKLKREAQDAIDAAYDMWAKAPSSRDTVGEYAADWTERRPRSARTNYDRNSKLRQVLDVRIDGRSLRDWPFAELERSHARELVDHMLRHQGRAAAGASAILRVLSAMAEDAIDDRCATTNAFKGVRMRAGDPRVTKPARETRIWTLDDMHEFAAAAGNRNEPMLRMLSDCGMRVGEMLALRRGLQDLRTGIFRVKGTAWNGSVIETSREKNHDREGPIPPGTLALLRAMPAWIDVEWLFPTPGSAHTRRPRIDWPSREELLAKLETMSYTALSRKLGVSDSALRKRLRAYEAGRRLGDGRGRDGGKLWRYDNWMRDVWNPTAKRTGMKATPKEFRASWETHLIAAGANTDDVAAIAGHSVNVQAEHLPTGSASLFGLHQGRDRMSWRFHPGSIRARETR